MNRFPAFPRSVAAALLALLLGLRLLSPPGFMPSFEHGTVAIVACPDAEVASAPMAHHHHGDNHKLHQICPYAAGASPVATNHLAEPGPSISFEQSRPNAQPLESLSRQRARERPPLRGPPLTA
jgi:hypothetical protein